MYNRQKIVVPLPAMDGLVTKSTGSDYQVRLDDGQTALCKVKGNFRIKGLKSTSPVVVGDRVTVDGEFITRLHDRRNYIVRKPTNLSKQLHIIAANIDQAMLVVTLKNPTTATAFIDRFLATAEAYRIPTILLFNKIDILDAEEGEYLDGITFLYRTIGYPCLCISAEQGSGMDEVRDAMTGRLTLLSGNSGVGKSTIINTLMPEAEAKTAPVSDYHLKGMHTTTFSQIFELDSRSGIIDTPGIKGFGLVDMTVQDVGHFFPEIFAASKNCRFANCTHRHEPDCAVIAAVENYHIAQSRYESYLSIVEDINEGKYR